MRPMDAALRTPAPAARGGRSLFLTVTALPCLRQFTRMRLWMDDQLSTTRCPRRLTRPRNLQRARRWPALRAPDSLSNQVGIEPSPTHQRSPGEPRSASRNAKHQPRGTPRHRRTRRKTRHSARRHLIRSADTRHDYNPRSRPQGFVPDLDHGARPATGPLDRLRVPGNLFLRARTLECPHGAADLDQRQRPANQLPQRSDRTGGHDICSPDGRPNRLLLGTPTNHVDVEPKLANNLLEEGRAPQ